MRFAIPLAFASALALGQSAALTLTNVRATYGLLGPARADTRVLPGDTLFLEFDIDGITVAADGRVRYAVGLEAVGPDGKAVFRQNPTEQEALASLGGSTVPGQAHVDVGLDQPPGDYTVKVTVSDRAGKQTGSFQRKLQVLPADFGIVQVNVTSDPNATVPAGLVEVGESVWVNFALVRFDRDKSTKQPNVRCEMRVLDEGGKPTLAKPDTGVINQDVPARDKVLGGQFHVAVNRPGKFVVELRAVDAVAGKSAAASFPLAVHPRR